MPSRVPGVCFLSKYCEVKRFFLILLKGKCVDYPVLPNGNKKADSWSPALYYQIVKIVASQFDHFIFR